MADPETGQIQVHVNVKGSAESILGRELPLATIDRAIRITLAREGVLAGEISVTLLDDEGIQELNRTYLDHDCPTDVISFPLHDPGDPLLGDVYVGLEQARRQADEHGVALEEELVRLAIHGTLHVLGYEHPQGQGRGDGELYRIQEALVLELMSPL